MVRFALSLLLAVLALAPAAQAGGLPLFDVGTSVVDITPTTPQYLGGYDHMETPTAVAHDPLEVRAFFAGHGANAVAFAIVDSQGWFAGYQEGPYGVTEARQEAAAQLRQLGYDVQPANLIVSSTHSHAAPTIMGVWGPTDPAYLKRVHDATVQALVAAARAARPAELWTGEGDISDIIAHNLEGTDHFDGWGIDATTPVLWARDPQTGATRGLYVNVPVHADQYDGSESRQASADHPGYERAELDRLLGGTAVVAMGTLGRQETMGGIHLYSEVERQGTYIANAIMRALAHAHPVTSPILAGAEQYIAVPAHNAALLALLYANAAGSNCDNPTGNCTIDRSLTPPYLAGNVVGTWVTALRIGDAAWVSEPGEAFPEVSQAIRDAVGGASEVHVVGMAQDQLGYYYPPEDYPASQLNPSDFILFNVSPTLADENADAAALLATQLGFDGTPQHPMMDDRDPQAFLTAGSQYWPSVAESADPTRELLVGAHPSEAPSPSGHTVSAITVDYGDGSPKVVVAKTEDRLTHTFPRPGSYRVSTTVTDDGGTTRTHTGTIVVDPPLEAVAVRGARRWRAELRGGDGHVIAARWAFADGSSAEGLAVRGARGAHGTLTVVDGAGDTATTAF
jgi:hypothetical protein